MMGLFGRKATTAELESARGVPDTGMHPESADGSEKGHQNPAGNVNASLVSFTDPVAEMRLVRKLDRRLVPLVMGLYLLAYLDRSNIGNAKTAGMATALNFNPSGSDYQWLLTIFYIAYIVFEWFALMWKLVPPHIWAAVCVLGWGIAATCQAAATSWSGMMAARFFLGMFEAGFGPGIPYLLSFFYMRNELGLRCGLFLSAAPLATCFAGALAYGITSGNPPTIANWRLLFLVEGLPCIVAAALAFFLMPDSPEKARFLTAEDKLIAKQRAVRQVGTAEAHRVGGISWPDVGAALIDPKNWLTAFMYFSCNVSFSSLPVFLPTILTEMGFTTINAQGLSAPPYFLSFLIVVGSCWIADKTQQRGLTIICLSLVGFSGYVMLAVGSSVAVRYAGVFLAAAGIFPSIGNILPWVLNNQGSDTKRGAGIAVLNIIGQCGPLLGTNSFPAAEGPFYRRGMWICASFMLFNALLALGLRTLLRWENGRLDAKYGVLDRQKTNEEREAEAKIGSENDGPNFRYIL